jgi:tetraacyldisaccharide 4'-kinase
MISFPPIWWRLLWPVRVAAAPIYALGLKAHKGFYAAGIKRACRPPVPVICVGNLSTGGTGKTPLVISIVKMLQASGRTVAVLTRGYKSRAARVVQAVSLRDLQSPAQTKVSPGDVGDEPFLLIEKLAGAHMLISPDRAASAKVAVEELKCDVLVMDDGFQHWALERDLDIVVVDASQPERLNHLMPWGNLREGFGALDRAQVAVIAKARDARERERAAARVRSANPAIAVWHVDFAPREIRRLSDAAMIDAKDLDAQPVILVCGLASPGGFEEIARRLGCRIAGRFFYPDHFSYPDLVIRWLELQAHKLGARLLLTTEKDAVKLRGRITANAPWAAVTIETLWLDPMAERVQADLEELLIHTKELREHQRVSL